MHHKGMIIIQKMQLIFDITFTNLKTHETTYTCVVKEILFKN